MKPLPSPRIALPAMALLIAAVSGCAHALEVDVPDDFHGRVTILCERVQRVATPIHVRADGNVPNALCPTAQTSLTVVRNGQSIKPSSEPRWGITGDGIVLSVEFDIP